MYYFLYSSVCLEYFSRCQYLCIILSLWLVGVVVVAVVVVIVVLTAVAALVAAEAMVVVVVAIVQNLVGVKVFFTI